MLPGTKKAPLPEKGELVAYVQQMAMAVTNLNQRLEATEAQVKSLCSRGDELEELLAHARKLIHQLDAAKADKPS
jgi:hypothetical protein